MLIEEKLREALTFDDVLLVPAESDILPRNVDVRTRLTSAIPLNLPLVSSAMDTVTEAATAICMAREGGIGFIHKNLSVEEQALEVVKVKKAESGMVVDPVTIEPDQRLAHALELMRRHSISGLPVVKDGRAVGILTNRDIRFERNLDQRVRDVMTSKLVTAPDGTTLEEAKELLHKNRIEKLIVVDAAGRMRGLITIKDIEKAQQHPTAVKDELGRLRVGAAVGVGADREERIHALLGAGCDVICIDTAHGHSKNVIDAVAATRRAFPNCQLVAGNVSTAEGTEALIKAGVDAVKVGQGPGSICTHRIVARVRVPQISAIAGRARDAAIQDIANVAGGGIKYSGDRAKGVATGAQSVKIGSLVADTDDPRGEVSQYQGRSDTVYRTIW